MKIDSSENKQAAEIVQVDMRIDFYRVIDHMRHRTNNFHLRTKEADQSSVDAFYRGTVKLKAAANGK